MAKVSVQIKASSVKLVTRNLHQSQSPEVIMVAITIKPAKENSKTRKFKRTGEFFAAKDANRVLASRIESAFTKLSEGCTSRVYKATMSIPIRSTELPSADNICLPDVAIFSAGFRKPTETITAR
ncbi:transcriptional antitermination N peptide [Yersinia enterocolitica]